MLFNFLPQFNWYEIWSACNATTISEHNRINSIFWIGLFYITCYHYFKKILQVKSILLLFQSFKLSIFHIFIQNFFLFSLLNFLIDVFIFLATFKGLKIILLQMELNRSLYLELLFLCRCYCIFIRVSEIFFGWQFIFQAKWTKLLSKLWEFVIFYIK